MDSATKVYGSTPYYDFILDFIYRGMAYLAHVCKKFFVYLFLYKSLDVLWVDIFLNI